MLDKLIVWAVAVAINFIALLFCYKISHILGIKRLWAIFLIMPLVAMVFRISAIFNLYFSNDLLLFIMNYISPVLFSIACLIYVWKTYKVFQFHFK